ncbi:conserved protein of unknown function [Acetoanaerobium sticklandii]|uniref:Uncharacterized protein n=1 Tax=Acetoanaerobium sticklandii (strain ATCC 12662 / DSM 519 / JCM 1433 / CCUG 9281 / NCIMB 10654 / HF) TaxID=499177 RepID=E3PR36_ACESD|nr:DUF3800 domain-containing protein [Acetoanaerobium sticklandii]CBH20241.1 conserved protein of unknown function [Acetoanaerobium sticklandii]
MGWRNRPTYIEKWPKHTDVIMFIDENGESSLKNIQKKIKKGSKIDINEKIFTITGCVINKKNFLEVRENIISLKDKYWDEGKFNYNNIKIKRVCFHSNEVRGRKGPFSDKVIDYNNFICDLSGFMENLPATIFSSTIDKEEHCKKYITPLHPYNLCLDFVLERFVKYYLKPNEYGVIVLEARGAGEDRFVLNHIKEVIDKGTRCVNDSYFKKIKGVYFNPKWCKKHQEQLSYFGLECADLYSYPIHKHIKFNTKDKPFEILEKKIYGYPNYSGYGLKVFP